MFYADVGVAPYFDVCYKISHTPRKEGVYISQQKERKRSKVPMKRAEYSVLEIFSVVMCQEYQ